MNIDSLVYLNKSNKQVPNRETNEVEGGLMNMKYYVVDAFTEELFKGNPAGVCLVDEFPTDETMTNIAAENRGSIIYFGALK